MPILDNTQLQLAEKCNKKIQLVTIMYKYDKPRYYHIQMKDELFMKTFGTNYYKYLFPYTGYDFQIIEHCTVNNYIPKHINDFN